MLKYKDIFQSELVGFTADGHAVVHKTYVRIEGDPKPMVAVDAGHNKDVWSRHGRYVLLVNLLRARAGVPRILRYARAFNEVDDVIPPDAVHVMNSPAWCRHVWRVVRRLVSAHIRNSVHFHAGGTEELEGTGHLPVKSRLPS